MNATKTVQVKLGLKYEPVAFQSHALAFGFADRFRAGTVMLGEGAFWVVCLADACRLARAGYEYAD